MRKLREPPSWNRQGRCPGGNRPAHERSVFDPRRVVIIRDVAATLEILPVPTIALILRRTFELLLGDVGAVPPKAGVIAEGGPGDRIVVVAVTVQVVETYRLRSNLRMTYPVAME